MDRGEVHAAIAYVLQGGESPRALVGIIIGVLRDPIDKLEEGLASE